jgi:hypothetical protein
VELLDRIDRLVDGLCACGGEPRDGSAYCGDDCVPNHVSVDTDLREAGDYATPMRWRPDLVTAVDDSDRSLISEFPRGRFNAQVFEYVDTDSLHLRLDDGHRFVGCDIDGLNSAAGYRDDAWQRLERELGNTRHVEEDPWADVMRDAYERASQRMDEIFFGSFTEAQRPGTIGALAGTTPSGHSAWAEVGFIADDGLNCRWPDGVAATLDMRLATFTTHPLAGMRQAIERACQSMAPALREFSESVRRSFPQPQPELDHPMLAAIERRRHRNTGPEQRQRAPRTISPRH